MADVFEELPHLDEHRLRLMMLIERTPELDWLLLTKRPEFARDWLTRWYGAVDRGNFPPGTRAERPCRNVWVGVSIENARYTWRADVLREIPAAVRFISAEPLLGSVFAWEPRRPATAALIGASAAARLQRERAALDLTGIDWVIIGGESGPGARPFHLEHARELIEQVYSHRAHEHRGYGSPAIFVKQLGARPLGAAFVAGDPLTLTGDHTPLQLRDRKGGDWDEWPTDLRIREYPASAALRASDELMETA
jgi:protein gp37